MFNLASWRNFKAVATSFLSLLLTFVDDMFDGNMAVLVEFYNFYLSRGEKELDCGQTFSQIFTDDGWKFPLICTRADAYELLSQFIPLNVG